jgi:hypothetical protein
VLFLFDADLISSFPVSSVRLSSPSVKSSVTVVASISNARLFFLFVTPVFVASLVSCLSQQQVVGSICSLVSIGSI